MGDPFKKGARRFCGGKGCVELGGVVSFPQSGHVYHWLDLGTLDRAPGYLWLIITVGPVALTIDLIKVHGFCKKNHRRLWGFFKILF